MGNLKKNSLLFPIHLHQMQNYITAEELRCTFWFIYFLKRLCCTDHDTDHDTDQYRKSGNYVHWLLMEEKEKGAAFSWFAMIIVIIFDLISYLNLFILYSLFAFNFKISNGA